jgi:hypothetical protein
MKESVGGHNNTSAYALVYVDEHWRGTSLSLSHTHFISAVQ